MAYLASNLPVETRWMRYTVSICLNTLMTFKFKLQKFFQISLGNGMFVRHRKGSSNLFTQNRWDVYPTARSDEDLKELRSNCFEVLCLEFSV